MFVDSHAHLYFKDFQHDLEDVVKRAVDRGVAYIICPGTDLETSRRAIELAERFEQVYAAVGLHPHDAKKAATNGGEVDRDVMAALEELSRHPKVVAIGEIGLDYHYDFSPREIQREVFSEQISIARRRDLPIIVHTRESEKDVLEIVERHVRQGKDWRARLRQKADRYPPPRGVFHCFPGDVEMAWRVINLGFYISIPGPVTFPAKPGKNSPMVEVAQKVSAEHILLETDCPYLTPHPHRGKRNEPAYVPLIASRIAELQGLSIEDIARASTFGVTKLFGIGEYPRPVFAYKIRDSLYLNITIRCNADCVFCDRKGEAIVRGHNLRIEREPSVEEVIREIDDPKRYDEIVFCGFGEPTIRVDALKHISKWVKENGGVVRLNTDGHGSLINYHNIVPELVGLVDAVSISLNTIDPDQYSRLMQIDGGKFFPAMVEFAKECVKHGLDVTMTMVDLQSVNEAKTRAFVENEIGAKFKNRPYF
jgi:TatD DNase family protein